MTPDKLHHVAATGVILAGGESSRFGRPKASALLAGRPLIEYPMAAMQQAGLDVAVVAKRGSDIGEVHHRRIDEPDSPRHPLCGIITALEVIDGPIIVCACDMPFVPGELLAWLAGRDEDLVVPESGGSLQPLLARYSPGVLGCLRSAIEQEQSMRAAVAASGARVVSEGALRRFGDPQKIFADVDTPSALAEAAAHLRAESQ